MNGGGGDSSLAFIRQQLTVLLASPVLLLSSLPVEKASCTKQIAAVAGNQSGSSGRGKGEKERGGRGREEGTTDKAVDPFFRECRKLTVAKVQNEAQRIFKATKDTRQWGRAQGGRGSYVRSGSASKAGTC